MINTKTITVFTPTYNRAYCLDQIYQSLVKQTSQDFLWLVIDDGSTDNTKEVVANWIAEGKIAIKYHYQENLGMHGGHNAAYRLITTELNVCIDSDDFMPVDAIEKILYHYPSIKDNPKFAGLVGLDADKKGDIIGSKIPEIVKETTLIDLYQTHKVTGDKKLVYKTAIIKKYPAYPIFEGERFVPLGYLYQLIDQDYVLKPVNEVFCIVEYLQDGSSLNMLKQYRRHPKGFAFSRITEIKYAKNFKEKIKKIIHFISSNLLAKNFKFISKSPEKTLTILALPLGFMLYLYILIKTKKNV
ncbi:glycosyltransferase involved in cell wall biosynthesis [Cellulophaga sp. RHA19]|uniref:glycosyltransferase family 2 protein n=1 Tax=Cellulophaga sp. RHA19 TaxID=1798237 RepID=UPI000C2B9951|nr:glycosyltransferase family 2 protein [Cellulophaga sp. RHA19]PKB44657.1 glycosyltransferase involved in cell wall biosynthesis [Cellulophaga sp. RHA19]